MNCTRAEQLIPLDAGGDLLTPEADGLRQHLQVCAQCQQMAEEFAASQAWLSDFAAPSFDEAVFADLRASVRREIEQTESAGERGRWFGWFWPNWDPRLAFAAAAVLILLSVLAAVAYRSKRPALEPAVAGGNQPKNIIVPPSTPQREEQQIVVGNHPKYPRAPRVTPSRQQPAPDDPAAGAVEPAATNLTAQNSTEPATNSSLAQAMPEMLRIEFQTDDPNIRIVWFAPKSPKTEPNTK